MKFPSLIFISNNRTQRNDHSVFTDLKLDLLLSEDTLNVISYYTSPEDIEARAQIFAELENEDIKNHYSELNKTAGYILKAVEKMNGFDSEISRHVLFVTALRYYCVFARLAAETKGGSFAKRFSEYFSGVAENEISKFEEEVNCLYENCSKALKIELYVDPEKAALGHQTGEDYESKLLQCAEYFGADIAEIEDDTCFEYITERAIKEYGSLGSELAKFYADHEDKFDVSVCDYAKETGFYLEVFSLICRMKEWGIPVCRPVIFENSGISASGAFDFTLMAKNEKNIVPNDVALTDNSKFCFLRGANGGGKTTYLRCVGVNTVLALCGACAAAKSFETFDFEKIYSHFPRDERFDRGGRLNDEEARLKPIQNSADEKALVLLNETFSTTGATQSDEMTAALAKKLHTAGCTGIYVTHAKIDTDSDIPILCVAVDPGDENRRTYRVEKEIGAGGSFAEDILRRYSLDKLSLSERFGEI